MKKLSERRELLIYEAWEKAYPGSPRNYFWWFNNVVGDLLGAWEQKAFRVGYATGKGWLK